MIYNLLFNLNLYSDHLLVNLFPLFILSLNSFIAFVIKYLCYLTGVSSLVSSTGSLYFSAVPPCK